MYLIFLKKSLMLSKAAFVWKNIYSNIVKYYYNLK